MNGEDGDDSTESQNEPVTDGGAQAQEMQGPEPEKQLKNFLRFVTSQEPDEKGVEEARAALAETLQEVAQDKDLTEFECTVASLILGIEEEYQKKPHQ